jgi:Ser/Thr protein kinase RdoA (MazF antagonist)
MTDQSPDIQLQQAASVFFPEAASIVAVPGHANLVRVEAPSGEWRVRQWPVSTAPERIQFVHAVLDTAAQAGLAFTPRLHHAAKGSLLHLEGRSFDATSWIPGRPAGRYQQAESSAGELPHVPASLSQPTLAVLTARVAELHEALRPAASRPDAPRVTIQGIERAVHAAWQSQRDRLRPVAARTPMVQRWLRTAERGLPVAEEALAGTSVDFARREVVGHFGLWPAHVILRRTAGEEQIAGLIDFSQAAAGPPVLDLAQVATRFANWSADTVELVTGAYSGVAALPPEDRRLFPAVAVLDLTAEVGRLLSAIYAGPDEGRGPAPVHLRSGADALLTSLEVATTALVRLQGPDRPPRRQWVPGPRKKPKKSQPPRREQPRRDR